LQSGITSGQDTNRLFEEEIGIGATKKEAFMQKMEFLRWTGCRKAGMRLEE